jgi:hypothetical protein
MLQSFNINHHYKMPLAQLELLWVLQNEVPGPLHVSQDGYEYTRVKLRISLVLLTS